MLTRTAAAWPVLLAVVAAVGVSSPAAASDGVCKGRTKYVTVCVKKPGEEPGGGDQGGRPPAPGAGGGGEQRDHWECTYSLKDPQPPAGSPEWEGHQPGDGAVYRKVCEWIDDKPDGYFQTSTEWRAEPPPAAVDPAVLAQQAVDSMLLTGPEIASPRAEGTYTVGVPLWLWVTPSPTTWGPNTASASAGGITVSATARVSSISWRMGDGSSVTCSGPGTQYTAARGMTPSPDCGHLYRTPSSGQSGAKYQGTATTTWTVDWAVTGGGQTGQLTEVRDTAFAIAVGELQVVGQ
ncbi:ATP/GTP-binding protein [Streptomyces sp. NBC_00162]|uniref:ATP/GTP-binding protein n=1 Tax=Streptomyces sp. NBC_00162 TaxID=2903629 RepID=UPI00214AD027|nr:ATP/GTP-binding protein [Streptomyces sp. NBC_00162]UUU37550.1 ATP/GTP-binding protein [Streptomyces sp. NBC_00162]